MNIRTVRVHIANLLRTAKRIIFASFFFHPVPEKLFLLIRPMTSLHRPTMLRNIILIQNIQSDPNDSSALYAYEILNRLQTLFCFN